MRIRESIGVATFGTALALTLAPLVLGGCLDITQNGGGGSGQTTGATAPVDAGAAAIKGAGCGIVGTSIMCRATSYCPTIVMDDAKFPNCAFRIRGNVVDIQCVCGGEMLCPMGTPTTCAETTSMLAQQTEAQVCVQISEGRCTPIAGDGGVRTGPSDCDRVCAETCGSDPYCRRTCGC